MSKVSTRNIKSNYGDGSFRVRKNGLLEMRIYDSRIGRQVAVYGWTPTELKRNVRDKKKEILSKKSPTSNKNVEDYVREWLNNYKFFSVKRTTYDKHEQMLDNHISPRIGYVKISRITSDEIQKMFNDLSKIRARSTLKKVYEVLYPCFKHAEIVGDIDKNPMLAVKIPSEENMKVKTKEIIFYSHEDLNKLEETLIGIYEEKKLYRLAPMYIFLAHTGLRRGELLALEWTDVDLKNKQIHITKALSRHRNRDEKTNEYIEGYTPIITTPKTKNSKRFVPLNSKAIWCLEEMKRRNELENVSSKYVCSNRDGELLATRSFDQMLERLCKSSNVKFKGLHSLRHSFATRCFQKGIDPAIVSKLLGHSSVKVTYEVYIHILGEQKIEAVEMLEAI